jgi:hypothetical protein
MKHAASIGLALALAIAGIVSACESSNPDAKVPPTATNEPVATATPTETAAATAPPASTGAPTANATSTGAPTASTPPPSAAPPGPPVMASKMAEDLKKEGFDLAKLPPKLAKMPDAQKKKIMKLFVKSLGYESCTGCHVENDFKKKTRNMAIAAHMYDDFVAGLHGDKGAANIFCDSCHQGKAKFLVRTDLKAVGKFMDEQYVGHMERTDKKDHACGTCHGDTMEMKVFDKLWLVNKGI